MEMERRKKKKEILLIASVQPSPFWISLSSMEQDRGRQAGRQAGGREQQIQDGSRYLILELRWTDGDFCILRLNNHAIVSCCSARYICFCIEPCMYVL
jgi:hypothetical protein